MTSTPKTATVLVAVLLVGGAMSDTVRMRGRARATSNEKVMTTLLVVFVIAFCILVMAVREYRSHCIHEISKGESEIFAQVTCRFREHSSIRSIIEHIMD